MIEGRASNSYRHTTFAVYTLAGALDYQILV
jgi:hypothetical protein